MLKCILSEFGVKLQTVFILSYIFTTGTQKSQPVMNKILPARLILIVIQIQPEVIRMNTRQTAKRN